MITGRLCAYYPVFEDLEALSKTIPKIIEFGITDLFFCDGPFMGFAQHNKKSQDGTRELCKQHGTLLDAGICFEEDKLNMSFEHIANKGFKYILLLGADEWPEGDIKLFLKNLGARFDNDDRPHIPLVRVQEHSPDSKWNRVIDNSPKIFVNPSRIRAKHAHWLYYLDGAQIPFHDHEPLIDGIIIHHDDSLRSEKRNKMMSEFQDWNVPREQKLADKAQEAK